MYSNDDMDEKVSILVHSIGLSSMRGRRKITGMRGMNRTEPSEIDSAVERKGRWDGKDGRAGRD